MKWQKLLSLTLAMAMVLSLLAGCGNNKNTVKKNSFDTEIQSTRIGDTFIAENADFTLNLNEITMGVTLTDKATGKIYGTNPIDEGGIQYDDLGMPIKRHPQLESVLFIKYLNTETNNVGEMISYSGAVSNGRTVYEKTENGVKVNYYFDDAEIMVPVTYTLRDKGVALSINPAEVQENGNMLLSVSVAPFFCSVKNTEQDGYLLYPSGSGALIYPKEISQPGESYSEEIYGVDASKEVWDKVATGKAIKLPVLGAKFGEQAVFGIVEEGAESSLLDMKVGSTSIGYSSIYVTYQLRGFTANIKELYNNRYYKGDVYSNNTVTTPLTVCYYPLEGEKANYSSMAELYRGYLDETVGKAEGNKISTLDINMVGGVMIKKSFVGIPYESLYVSTTIKDASEIAQDMKASGINISNLSLLGFGKDGIDSNKLGGNFKLDSKLGSVKDLAALQAECEKSETGFYFDFDIVKFSKTANGYNSYFDAATRANKKVAKYYSFDIAVLGRNTEKAYSVLARDRISDAASDALKAAEKWGLGGVGLSSLSSMAYSDYSDKQDGKYYAKAGFATQVSEVYKTAKVKTMANDANVYAAAYSDLTLGVPTFSTQSFLFDEDVPFYAMVLRGRTAISGDSLNLTVDADKQLLRSVESGAGIAYTITNAYSTQLLDTTSPFFYNSLYVDLKENIKENYNKVAALYEKIGNSEIKSHTIHENSLRETEFSNGVKVYVNYTDATIASEAGEVPANSFLVGEAKS